MEKRLPAMIALVALTAVASCGLPRSGPSKKEIFSGSIANGGTTNVVPVTDAIAQATRYQPTYGFSNAFRSAGPVGADTISAGDTLSLGIWENVDDGLLTGLGEGSTQLTQLQVDGDGYIFVPYAGRVRAAGRTTEQLRQVVASRLGSQTPDPQVLVIREAGDGATVSLMGKINGQGVYPIERSTRNLSAMLAKAGGVSIEPEVAVVTVKRGNSSGKVWLRDLYSNPANDISLRPGDVVLVEEDSRSFTALGALGGQTQVPLGNEQIDALEAIAMVGGLSQMTADPTGVFVLRTEPEAVARRILGGRVFYGDQRMAYILDLTRPDGMFMAREFIIRDGDTVYVTEAPYVTWTKTIGAITGGIGQAASVAAIAN